MAEPTNFCPVSRFKRAKHMQMRNVPNATSVNRTISAAKHLIRNEKLREALSDPERRASKNASTEIEERTKAVISWQDAAPAAIQDNGRESEGLVLIADLEITRRDREFQSNAASIDDWRQQFLKDARKVTVGIYSLHNNNIRLLRERDAARIEMQNQKRQCKKLKEGMLSVELEKRVMERDLKVVREEAETLKISFKNKHRCNQDKFKNLAIDIRKHIEKQHSLEKQLVCMREEKDRLNSSLQTTRTSLEEEREKKLCQICLESPKDAFCQPCLHLHYCFPCLDKYVEQNCKSCPSCRTVVSGVMKLYS